MPKPDLKVKNNEGYPMVRIRFECDRRVIVLPHTLNIFSYKSVSKTDSSLHISCGSVGVSVGWTVVVILPKELGS